MESLIAYWPVALIAGLVALALLFVLLRPRQRITLTDSAPVRPHMTGPISTANPTRNQSETTVIRASPKHSLIDQATDHAADDLLKLKGVGPKLASLLQSQGFTRFEQIAHLSPGQIAELDERLGAFRGRLTRDKVVEQANYLARGDVDGFEQRFGKL